MWLGAGKTSKNAMFQTSKKLIKIKTVGKSVKQLKTDMADKEEIKNFFPHPLQVTYRSKAIINPSEYLSPLLTFEYFLKEVLLIFPLSQAPLYTHTHILVLSSYNIFAHI